MKVLKGKFHEADLDISLCDVDIIQYLQEVIEQFDFEIIAFTPVGPAGGNSNIIFKGEYDKLIDYIKNVYYGGEASEMEMEDAKEWIEESDSDTLIVKCDERFLTIRNRRYISEDGKLIKEDHSPVHQLTTKNCLEIFKAGQRYEEQFISIEMGERKKIEAPDFPQFMKNRFDIHR